MKRNILLLSIVLSLVLLSTASNVQAQTNGLRWGITEGQRFDYRINGTRYNSGSEVVQIIQEDCYVIVENLSIESILGRDVYTFEHTKYWANGSEFTYPMWPNIHFMVYPVGNWTYISELYMPDDTLLPEMTVEAIDTETVWGYKETISLVYHSVETFKVSKTDGATYYFKSVWTNITTGLLKGEYEVTRIVSSIDPILLVGSVAGVTVILVVALVFMKKRSV